VIANSVLGQRALEVHTPAPFHLRSEDLPPTTVAVTPGVRDRIIAA
jgi:hypothetical protein